MLKPTVGVFGDRALKEVIKIKRSPDGKALIQSNQYPFKKKRRWIHREERPQEDTARWELSTSQEDVP